jgi:galactokinase
MTSTWAAPGRVNLIGEHVDYNDGLVLPFALPWTTVASATASSANSVSVDSDGMGTVQFPIEVAPGEVSGWGAYVAGVLWALRDAGHRLPGLDLHISSDVPDGAGLSSSAALTCSVAAAVNAECDIGLDRPTLAGVARTAENDFVGAPTGAMDQLASLLCEADAALLLDCQSMQWRQIPFDLSNDGLTLLLIDTKARHELVGSEYGDRRRDCEAAASALGVSSLREASLDGVEQLSDERLRRRAQHVVTEIQRVAEVAELLEHRQVADIGPLLTASHNSLRDDFDVSVEALDVTVDAAVSAGALGARMVGGGFGGCVIALCRADDQAAIRQSVQSTYDDRGWDGPTFSNPHPSAGAHPFERE